MKLLVTSYMQEEYVEEFKKMFDEIKFVGMMQIDRILTEDELIQEIADADAIVVEFDPLTRKVLESAKKLKVIASVRGGAHALSLIHILRIISLIFISLFLLFICASSD